MTNRLLKTILGLSAILTLAITATAADRLVVKIPFDFRVGDMYLKSGSYSVNLLFGNTVQIRSEDGHNGSYSMSFGSGRSKNENVLTFNRYGNDYFLSEVNWAGLESTRKLVPAKVEKELVRNGTPV